LGIKPAITTDMKLTIAFLAIVVALSFGACTSSPVATKEVTFIPCCMGHDPEKVVLLTDSWAPGGTVVHLIH
jgi:hypothetical protein